MRRQEGNKTKEEQGEGREAQNEGGAKGRLSLGEGAGETGQKNQGEASTFDQYK